MSWFGGSDDFIFILFSIQLLEKLIRLVQWFNDRAGFTVVLCVFTPRLKGSNVPFIMTVKKIHLALMKLSSDKAWKGN